MISYHRSAPNCKHCLVYSCFTMNRKNLFHILAVQAAIGNRRLSLDVTGRVAVWAICSFPLTIWQRGPFCSLLETVLAGCKAGLCGFCSVPRCLCPWILLFLLCHLWMRIWDFNFRFVSSVRPCLEKHFHINCWSLPSNNNSRGPWNARYQFVISLGKIPCFTL